MREKVSAEIKGKSNILDVELAPTRPAPKPDKPIPFIKDVIGNALSHIGTYKELDNKKQVVALIDDVRTMNMYMRKSQQK